MAHLNEPLVKDLFDLIVNAPYCVALTGAGVSTLSGIRDFRGTDGLYTDPTEDAQKMFDLAYFKRDPAFYYKAASFIYDLDARQPSIVHTTLAKLETNGWLKAVITQNVDFLHQRGGSKKVYEVHGSPAVHYCI
jgi:NAD-dependent deacetylase